MTSSIIFAAFARMLMRQGCGEYIAHIVNKQLKSPCIKYIVFVCDFRELFIEKHPGLPPEREVEFPINHILGSAPISITPWRMAAGELRELKSQLQELLEKGYI